MASLHHDLGHTGKGGVLAGKHTTTLTRKEQMQDSVCASMHTASTQPSRRGGEVHTKHAIATTDTRLGTGWQV